MTMKFYAVKTGRKTGVYNTWDECKINVSGYPNAVYKSFTNYKDAVAFINNKSRDSFSKVETEICAYIDGSYDDSKKSFGYAAIIFDKNGKKVFSKAENNDKLVQLRNVAGELKAAMYVMEYAKKNSINSITIYYDYLGIEMWATGEWKANLDFTQKYVSYAKDTMKNINIIFKKVKSHTGNTYNEEVDKLAKQAIKEFNPKNKSYEEPKNVEKDEYNIIFERIKGSKNGNKFFILNNGYLITTEDISKIVKLKWKNRKRKLNEIIEIKNLYDVEKRYFVSQIITDKDTINIVTGCDEING